MALRYPHPQPHSYTCNQHICNLSMLVAEEIFNSSKMLSPVSQTTSTICIFFHHEHELVRGLNFGYLCRQWQIQQVQRSKDDRTEGRMTTTWRDWAALED